MSENKLKNYYGGTVIDSFINTLL